MVLVIDMIDVGVMMVAMMMAVIMIISYGVMGYHDTYVCVCIQMS